MKNKVMQAEIRLCEDGFYGVEIRDNKGEIWVYDSVTKRREALETLVRHVNEGDVSEAHLYDIIEDIIG